MNAHVPDSLAARIAESERKRKEQEAHTPKPKPQPAPKPAPKPLPIIQTVQQLPAAPSLLNKKPDEIAKQLEHMFFDWGHNALGIIGR